MGKRSSGASAEANGRTVMSLTARVFAAQGTYEHLWYSRVRLLITISTQKFQLHTAMLQIMYATLKGGEMD
ncbi:hypothetical protein A2881_03035 [Candidatus Peribacteria bacterium RIFCSPHIGHO2_01_FULL_55_13]|nr:MAG: hypothetical protein A2881_03035 [Candidatus Peribacteria bacterium RIFCSPHIGHO2_01_FULL_55_13]OGJ65904.1 MAG: hypothetical protein A3F36_00710 [Candidatus Peribacteria bacterium RIFCSPHIGHO2_12_FULL_55_11]